MPKNGDRIDRKISAWSQTETGSEMKLTALGGMHIIICQNVYSLFDIFFSCKKTHSLCFHSLSSLATSRKMEAPLSSSQREAPQRSLAIGSSTNLRGIDGKLLDFSLSCLILPLQKWKVVFSSLMRTSFLCDVLRCEARRPVMIFEGNRENP